MTLEEIEDLADELSNIHNAVFGVRYVFGFGYCLTDRHGDQLSECMTKSEIASYLQGAINFSE